MTTICGEFGDGIRADVQVTVSDCPKLEVVVSSSVEAMYGDAIRAQVGKTIESFGKTNFSLYLRDNGAQPYFI